MLPAESSLRLRMVCLALFFGTLLLFARAVGHDFVNYDDPDYVTANEHVQAGLDAATFRWAFTTGEASNWHPLTWISHTLDWTLFGRRPAGHHATSLLWHAAGAVLAFLTLRRMTGAFWTSAFCAALWAWHPLRVESVAWIAERKDVLSGFCGWLALWAYAGYAARSREGKSAAGRWYALAFLAFAVGLLCKPMLVTLPCVLLLLDFWPLQRFGPAPASGAGRFASTSPAWPRLLAEKGPFFMLSVAASVVTYLVQQKGGSVSAALTLDARLANAVVAVARYLGKFFWPFDLAVLYPYPPSGRWSADAVFGAVVLLAAISGLALWQGRRRPWLAVGWLWFLGMLVPVIGLVQVGLQSMADRYTYLPIVGVQLALLWTVREFAARPSLRPAMFAAAGAVLLGCALRTWDQLSVWKNSFTLFDHAVRVTDGSYLAYNNLGIWLLDEHRPDEAIAAYRESLAINPSYEEAMNNLGHALAEKGLAREAVGYYRAALRTKPGLIEAHNNLGNALSDLGQIDDAIREYEFVLARRPRHADALNNYGVALAMKGRTAEAVERITAALRLKPDDVSAHSNLGNVYAMTGRPDDAIREYRRALALRPDDARVCNNLGNVLAEKGDLAGAVEHYEQALRLEPVNPEAHTNLGVALAKLGRRDEAIRNLRTALRQRPDYPQAQSLLQALTASPPTGK
jgi:tetratricopeptide (TPR) repeat protein